MSLLAAKTILVMGGTSGLGLSAARAFVRQGAQVVVVGRNRDGVDRAVADLGERAVGLCGDASLPGTAEKAVGLSLDVFGALDGLYHVAGGSGHRKGDGPLHAIPESGWEATLSHNLGSVFLSNRAVVRSFLDRGVGGVVLNCGSVLGHAPAPRHFGTHAYAAAKAALTGLTRSCAATYAGDGVRFNVVAPALVATPMSRRAQEDEDIMAYARRRQPLAREGIGEPADLDALVVCLMSDAARGITGQVVAVDWGWGVCDASLTFERGRNNRERRTDSHPA